MAAIDFLLFALYVRPKKHSHSELIWHLLFDSVASHLKTGVFCLSLAV